MPHFLPFKPDVCLCECVKQSENVSEIIESSEMFEIVKKKKVVKKNGWNIFLC